ncbi:MAG: hypothetical protein LBR07_05515 [Puniceicoccales bacterium]|jgi:hypothetical protein|nr:hypothetical protein [Puniceicoccales bacterium]
MQNFAAQCLDMARSILGHNLDSVNEDGSMIPVPGEESRADEPGHAAFALGEYHRATGDILINRVNIAEIVARCLNTQINQDTEAENGLGYSALGLLAFGPSKERNPVWLNLAEETRALLDKRLLERTDYDTHFQAFNIAKATARYSLGLAKRDETGTLIERFLERLAANGTGGYCDDFPRNPETRPDVLGGVYDIYGLMQFVFIRTCLQLHSNGIHLRERKLPSLRTHAEKYLKLLPEIVRQDGLGWCYGRGIGCYGQMHAISMILQAMRDNWIAPDKLPLYKELVRRLFQFFFATYLDQEHGFLVIRDGERDTIPHHTTRMANFDAARYLCQWSRLARVVGGQLEGRAAVPQRPSFRYTVFDKSNRKEQGLCVYQDPATGLHVLLPLVSGGTNKGVSDSLAFPHMPGVFDWPVNQYQPVFLPELTFGEQVFVPSFYGKNVATKFGIKNSFVFSYEQPELITTDEQIVPGIAAAKVEWEFAGSKITGRFQFQVKKQITLDKLRFVLPIAAPHSAYRLGVSFTLGAESLRCSVEPTKDDFQTHWAETEVVSDDPNHRTYYGKIHYYQTLLRDRPLPMRPGKWYRLEVSFEPHIVMIDEVAPDAA